MNKIYEKLIEILSLDKIKINEPLSRYTFTKTGGNADFLVFPETYNEVQGIVGIAKEEQVPFTVLGNGSNLIVRDGGIRGIVINLTKLTKIKIEDNKLVVQSGATIIETSRIAMKNSLTGLEFACGIPGTVGGAVYMNAGAYGGEVSDVLEQVVALTKEGDICYLSREELELGYRTSIVSKENFVVLEATFSLEHGEAQTIKEKMDKLTDLRETKQPLEYPSCGSVFKRPPGFFAGKLIQDSGLQGQTVGGAQVSTKHAGFIVNIGGATATDYLNLISKIQSTVKQQFNVDLETEVKIIGEDMAS